MTTRQQIETLKDRLNAGWQKIDEATERSEDTRNLIDFWIRLLHEYEAVADAVEQAPLAGMEGRR